MNDSPYGLTASVWTAAPDAFAPFMDGLEAGTVFLNRCVAFFSFFSRGFTFPVRFTPGEKKRRADVVFVLLGATTWTLRSRGRA